MSTFSSGLKTPPSYIASIESKIIEGTPLKAPHFRVRLNSHTITPRSLTGHKIPILEGTEFGPISGEIVILSETASSAENLGIEVKVKQVTVRRELFGMETWGKTMARVRGEVNADFLPITSDRTGFIKDSLEYEALQKVMQRIMEDVKALLQRLTAKKEGKKVSRALKEALQRIYRALASNLIFPPLAHCQLEMKQKGLAALQRLLRRKRAPQLKLSSLLKR